MGALADTASRLFVSSRGILAHLPPLGHLVSLLGRVHTARPWRGAASFLYPFPAALEPFAE